MATFRISLPMRRAQLGFRRVQVLFEGVYYPEKPFRAYVFLNQPNADESTQTEGNVHFIGEFSMMARKYIAGNEQRGLLPWARPAYAGRTEPDQPATIAIDATDALHNLALGQGEVSLSVVLVDVTGRRLPDELLRFDGIKLEIE